MAKATSTMTDSTLTPERAIRGLRSAGTPQISPDGARIVFSLGEVSRDSDKSASQLWIVDRDGGNARQLTWTGESHSSPAWSPDGRHLALYRAATATGRTRSACCRSMVGNHAS